MNYHARQLCAPWFFVRTWWQWQRRYRDGWWRSAKVAWIITEAHAALGECDREWRGKA